jgi:hypothetical protein
LDFSENNFEMSITIIEKEKIGSRVNIEYFASILLRTGLIIQRQITIHGINNWFVVELVDPFEYQLKAREPFQFTQL